MEFCKMRRLRIERRTGPDLLQRSFLWLAISCWGLFLVAMLAFHYARPEVEYGMLRYLDMDIRKSWDRQTLPLFLYALWSCCGITLLSILLNFSRNRRQEDYHIFNFVLLLLIALGGLALYYFADF